MKTPNLDKLQKLEQHPWIAIRKFLEWCHANEIIISPDSDYEVLCKYFDIDPVATEQEADAVILFREPRQ
jgi:hypothetical protein